MGPQLQVHGRGTQVQIHRRGPYSLSGEGNSSRFKGGDLWSKLMGQFELTVEDHSSRLTRGEQNYRWMREDHNSGFTEGYQDFRSMGGDHSSTLQGDTTTLAHQSIPKVQVHRHTQGLQFHGGTTAPSHGVGHFSSSSHEGTTTPNSWEVTTGPDHGMGSSLHVQRRAPQLKVHWRGPLLRLTGGDYSSRFAGWNHSSGSKEGSTVQTTRRFSHSKVVGGENSSSSIKEPQLWHMGEEHSPRIQVKTTAQGSVEGSPAPSSHEAMAVPGS